MWKACWVTGFSQMLMRKRNHLEVGYTDAVFGESQMYISRTKTIFTRIKKKEGRPARLS